MASTLAICMGSNFLSDRAAEQRHALDADVDLDEPASHRRAGDVKRSHVAAIERAPFAEYTVEYGAASIEEMQWLAVPVDDIDAARSDCSDPKVAMSVDLQAVGN